MKRTPLKRGGFLKRKTPLKTRDFRKRKKGRYGPLWEAVKRMPCFLLETAPELHTCGLGYAPATAHHVIPKGQDEEGLISCCGAVHDVLEAHKRRVTVDFASVCSGRLFEVNVRRLGLDYVDRAKDELGEIECLST